MEFSCVLEWKYQYMHFIPKSQCNYAATRRWSSTSLKALPGKLFMLLPKNIIFLKLSLRRTMAWIFSGGHLSFVAGSKMTAIWQTLHHTVQRVEGFELPADGSIDETTGYGVQAPLQEESLHARPVDIPSNKVTLAESGKQGKRSSMEENHISQHCKLHHDVSGPSLGTRIKISKAIKNLPTLQKKAGFA